MFWSSSNLESLALNLISELLGIGLTVFVIDRLLRRRERAHWNAARNAANARLFRVVEKALLQSGLDVMGRKLGETTVMNWADSSAVTSTDYSDVDVAVLRSRFLAAAAANVDFELISPTEAAELRESLSEILGIAGDHLPPDIHALVLGLNDQLHSVPNLSKFPAMDRADAYASLFEKVLRLRGYVLELATTSQPLSTALEALKRRASKP